MQWMIYVYGDATKYIYAVGVCVRMSGGSLPPLIRVATKLPKFAALGLRNSL